MEAPVKAEDEVFLPINDENIVVEEIIDKPVEIKTVKLDHNEIEANNKKKIKNILGIDMNYNDFIRKKHRLRKSLLTRASA